MADISPHADFLGVKRLDLVPRRLAVGVAQLAEGEDDTRDSAEHSS